jgi:hypothetical protein
MSWDTLTPSPPAGSQAPAGPHHATHETGGTDAIAALSGGVITSGTIADARLSSNVALKNIDNGFAVDQTIQASGAARLNLIDTSQPLDGKTIRLVNASGLLNVRVVDDAQAVVLSTPLSLNRQGDASVGRDLMVTRNLIVNGATFYEVGTWTPTLISSGGGVPTYNTQTGRFIRTGNFIQASFFITLATLGTLAAGTLTVGNLPFPVQALAPGGTPQMLIFNAFVTNWIYVYSIALAGSSTSLLRGTKAAGTSNVLDVTVADITGVATFAGGIIYGKD